MAQNGTANLIPFDQLSPEQAKAIRSKGARTLNAQKKRRKTFSEIADKLLALKAPEEQVQEIYMTVPELKGQEITVKDVVMWQQILQAKAGNSKAFETVRDTIGEKPVDKTTFTDIEGNPVAMPMIRVDTLKLNFEVGNDPKKKKLEQVEEA